MVLAAQFLFDLFASPRRAQRLPAQSSVPEAGAAQEKAQATALRVNRFPGIPSSFRAVKGAEAYEIGASVRAKARTTTEPPIIWSKICTRPCSSASISFPM